MVLAGCAGDKSRVIVGDDIHSGTPPEAPPLNGGPIVALTAVDAPGFAIADLTKRLRESMVRTSGADIVDDFLVRDEVAACVEMPCKETEQERFKNASLVASATLSRVGGTLIGSVRVQSGLKEIVRVNGQGKDDLAVIQQMGFEAGVALRNALTSAVPTSSSAPSEER